MRFKILVRQSFAASCSTVLCRYAMIFRILVAVVSTAVCYHLYAHGVGVPAAFSLLHGPTGVAVGVVGILLALAATPPLRACLVIGWLCLWFTTGLAELRASAVTDGTVLGGIIPYSDASNYLREASHLIEGHNMTPWATRPLAATYLAGHLYVARGHVTLALVFAGAFSAAAIGLAAIELRKSMGLLAATLWTWLLLVYCRRYLGEMMSEQAGVAFGALGVALLVRAFAGNAIRCLWPGLFILSLALNARAGALIVLPVLIAASTWRWRLLGRVHVLVLATLSVAVAFLMSLSFLKLLGTHGGSLISNYHNIAYGVVFGGNWQQAAADIPNYNQMDASAQAAEVSRRIVAALETKPSLIWRGAARNWSDFFTRSDVARGPFSFFRNPKTEFVLLILSGLGLLWSLPLWHRLSPLILATGVGIVLSVPFVPTPDADLMRAYAATMPLMFLIPAFSFAGWRAWMERFTPDVSRSRRPEFRIQSDADEESHNLNYCALPYLAVMLLLPQFSRFVAPISPAVTLKPKGPDIELTLDLNRATWIELSPAGDSHTRSPQRVPADEFKRGIFGSFHYFYPKQADYLESISRPGIALVCSGSTETAFLAINTKHLGNRGRKVVVLGRLNSADSNYDSSFLENSVVIPGIARQSPP